jgi:hypothetical protein
VLLFVIAAETLDEADGIGLLEDLGGEPACGYLESGDATLEIRGRPAVVGNGRG